MKARGFGLMAAVVAALMREPRTAQQLNAELSHVCLRPLRRLLRRLLDGNVIRISDWVGDRNAERVYSVGSEPSVPAPTKPRKNRTKPRPVRAPQSPATPMEFADRFCAIWHCLESPCSVAEICEEAGSTPGVVRGLLNDMRLSQPKLVRIAGYETDLQRTVLYERGSKPDAARPRPSTRRATNARRRDKYAAMRLHRALTFSFPTRQSAA